MLHSYLIHQLVDLVLAIAGVTLLCRFVRAPRARRWLARAPGLARTRFRRFVALVVPLTIVTFGALTLLFIDLLNGIVGPFFWEHWRSAVSVRFLGLGAAFYAGLAVLPIVGTWLAFARDAGDGATAGANDGATTRARSLDRALALLWLAASAAFLVDAMAIEPRRLVVETTNVELARWPAGARPLRIAVLADLQTALLTDRERRVAPLVQSLQPDLIVLAGDLVAQSLDDALPLESERHVLRRLAAPLGVFAVNGDVDSMVGGGIRENVRGTPARLLENESALLDAGFPLELVGFDAEDPEGFARACARPRAGRVSLALVHRPVHVLELAPAGFDLVIAGHTHGGQVVIPFFGPPITLSPLPRAVNAGGLHVVDGAPLYVSRGIGMEAGFAPPMRFLCPPEISLLIVGPKRGGAASATSSFDGARAGDERIVARVPLCWCPPGRFTMGSPADELERRPDEGRVEVTLRDGFWIGKFEVTQGEWSRIVGAFPVELATDRGDELPMHSVSFDEAEEFCRKLTCAARDSGELPPDREFRLPTEAQWEYACRAGTTTATSFGDSLSRAQANFGLEPYRTSEDRPALQHAAKVGSYPANAWGLHDVHGNVYEWCRDWYHARLPGGDDPDLSSTKGEPNQDGTFSRVRRGGAWCDNGWACRSAFRLRFEPERRSDHIGFRIVVVRARAG